MVLTVTEDTPADMLAGSMELLVQLPREHHLHTQRVTVQRSTPMMDLLVQIATAHKLAASSYTLQAIGERGLVLPHQSNTPIGALDALQVKLLPKQGTFVPKKVKPANQPFETTFRLQVHLPRNQLYVSRVSPKMNLGEILEEVCREKNLDKHKYELRHPVNLEEILDLSLSLQDYHLQEVTLYAKQGKTLGSALSSQDIMALQRQEERRRQQAKQSVFGFIFKKSKENSVSTDSLEGRSVSPARSDETGRSASPLRPPTRPQRKRRPAPKPPVVSLVSSDREQRLTSTVDAVTNATIAGTTTTATTTTTTTTTTATTTAVATTMPSLTSPATATATATATTSAESSKEKMLIGHSRNSSDSSGYHEASVLSDNPDSAARLPETLPRRNRAPGINDTPRKLAHTSHSSKSLGNLAATVAGVSGTASLDRALSSSSLSSTGLRKKRAAPPPPVSRPLSSAISSQALERIDDSEESLTSDMDPSKPPSDIGAPSKPCSDIDDRPKANSDIGVSTILVEKSNESTETLLNCENDRQMKIKRDKCRVEVKPEETSVTTAATPATKIENARVEVTKRDIEVKTLDTTEALLHKVSETLSPSSSPSSKEETNVASTEKKEDLRKERDGKPRNAENTSALSQQDTSDYVSALDDDLSVADWEYQLPAPPSAFRDSDSPVFDGYDTVTLRSVEAFKEPVGRPIGSADLDDDAERIREIEVETKTTRNPKKKEELDPVMQLKKEMIVELESKMEMGALPLSPKESDTKNQKLVFTSGNTVKSKSKVAPTDNHLTNFMITTYTRQKSLDIFEENTIRNDSKININGGPSNGDDEATSRKNEDAVEKLEKPSARNKKEPKMVFGELEAVQRWQPVNNGDYEKNNVQRSKSHASTMNRPKSRNDTQQGGTLERKREIENALDTVDDAARKTTSATTLNRVDGTSTWRGNEKFSQWRDDILKRQEEPTKEKQLQSLQVLKSILPQLSNSQQAEENVPKERDIDLREKTRSQMTTSSNGHPVAPNVLSTDCESHVTSARQVDKTSMQKENVMKRYTYNGPPAISLGSWAERPSVKVQIKMDTDYKLGRDNVAGGTTIVDINGSRGTKDSTATMKSHVKNSSKINPEKNLYGKDYVEEERKDERTVERKETDDLTRKLMITRTITSGLKKVTLNKVEPKIESSKNEDRPIVTAVELKKTANRRQELKKNNNNDDDDDDHDDGGDNNDYSESTIDTTPLNFKELTKAFGQDINHRIKPQRVNANRHSDYYGSQLDVIRKSIEQNKQQNGHAKPDEFSFRTNVFHKEQALPNGERDNANHEIKRFASIVGINSQGYHHQGQNLSKNNVTFKNNVNSNFKMKVPMPVVKGFKVTGPFMESRKGTNSDVGTSNQKVSLTAKETTKFESQPPKPPTMPVIMGVTLKSANARPKSTPIQVDSRDMLLESIRNFGGREKLRNNAEKY